MSLLVLLVVAGVAVAADTKAATGTVKSVGGNNFVVTDSGGKDWTFDVTKSTLIMVKGGSHKMDAIKADGKPAQLSEFLAAKQEVRVEYTEADGKMVAKEVRVTGKAK
jgi:hypothetical protein